MSLHISFDNHAVEGEASVMIGGNKENIWNVFMTCCAPHIDSVLYGFCIMIVSYVITSYDRRKLLRCNFLMIVLPPFYAFHILL